MQLSFQKLDLVVWYQCGLIYIISLKTPEGLAVFSIIHAPLKMYWHWRKWCNVFGRWPDICRNMPCSFMPPADSLAVVDYKMSVNGSRQGVFVLALQSSVMMCRRCNRCSVFVEQSLAHGVPMISHLSVLVDLHPMLSWESTSIHIQKPYSKVYP